MGSVTNRGDGSFAEAAQQWAHHSDLVMYARRVLGDRSDTAEDIVQEAYLRLLGLAASDEAPAGARPWLFRVVRNLAIDERRSAVRRADPVAEPDVLGTAARDDTASLVERREELAGALLEIAALPPRERRAIEMDQAGIDARAIATELGTTPNAVHQALFRARKRLRNARAVAWGLIPIGLAPVALRITDPALAVTMTNLPPGLPVGRALPVAGIVAAAMVGGSIVVPAVDHTPVSGKGTQLFVQRADAATVASSATSNGDNSDNTTNTTGRSEQTSSNGSDDGKARGDEATGGPRSDRAEGDGGESGNRADRRTGGGDDTTRAEPEGGRDSGRTRTSGSDWASSGGGGEAKTEPGHESDKSADRESAPLPGGDRTLGAEPKDGG